MYYYYYYNSYHGRNPLKQGLFREFRFVLLSPFGPGEGLRECWKQIQRERRQISLCACVYVRMHVRVCVYAYMYVRMCVLLTVVCMYVYVCA